MQNAAQHNAVHQLEDTVTPSAAVSYLDEFRPAEQPQIEQKQAPVVRSRSRAKRAAHTAHDVRAPA